MGLVCILFMHNKSIHIPSGFVFIMYYMCFCASCDILHVYWFSIHIAVLQWYAFLKCDWIWKKGSYIHAILNNYKYCFEIFNLCMELLARNSPHICSFTGSFIVCTLEWLSSWIAYQFFTNTKGLLYGVVGWGVKFGRI